MNENRVTVYLTKEAKEALEALRKNGDIHRGWLSQELQKVIVKTYEKRQMER